MEWSVLRELPRVPSFTCEERGVLLRLAPTTVLELGTRAQINTDTHSLTPGTLLLFAANSFHHFNTGVSHAKTRERKRSQIPSVECSTLQRKLDERIDRDSTVTRLVRASKHG